VSTGGVALDQESGRAPVISTRSPSVRRASASWSTANALAGRGEATVCTSSCMMSKTRKPVARGELKASTTAQVCTWTERRTALTPALRRVQLQRQAGALSRLVRQVTRRGPQLHRRVSDGQRGAHVCATHPAVRLQRRVATVRGQEEARAHRRVFRGRLRGPGANCFSADRQRMCRTACAPGCVQREQAPRVARRDRHHQLLPTSERTREVPEAAQRAEAQRVGAEVGALRVRVVRIQRADVRRRRQAPPRDGVMLVRPQAAAG